MNILKVLAHNNHIKGVRLVASSPFSNSNYKPLPRKNFVLLSLENTKQVEEFHPVGTRHGIALKVKSRSVATPGAEKPGVITIYHAADGDDKLYLPSRVFQLYALQQSWAEDYKLEIKLLAALNLVGINRTEYTGSVTDIGETIEDLFPQMLKNCTDGTATKLCGNLGLPPEKTVLAAIDVIMEEHQRLLKEELFVYVVSGGRKRSVLGSVLEANPDLNDLTLKIINLKTQLAEAEKELNSVGFKVFAKLKNETLYNIKAAINPRIQ